MTTQDEDIGMVTLRTTTASGGGVSIVFGVLVCGGIV